MNHTDLVVATRIGLEETRKMIVEVYEIGIERQAIGLADPEKQPTPGRTLSTLSLKQGESKKAQQRSTEELDRADRRLTNLVQFYAHQVRLIEALRETP